MPRSYGRFLCGSIGGALLHIVNGMVTPATAQRTWNRVDLLVREAEGWVAQKGTLAIVGDTVLFTPTKPGVGGRWLLASFDTFYVETIERNPTAGDRILGFAVLGLVGALSAGGRTGPPILTLRPADGDSTGFVRFRVRQKEYIEVGNALWYGLRSARASPASSDSAQQPN